MDSWKELLHGDWEPQKIIKMLPKYMEFFEDFQNIRSDVVYTTSDNLNNDDLQFSFLNN